MSLSVSPARTPRGNVSGISSPIPSKLGTINVEIIAEQLETIYDDIESDLLQLHWRTVEEDNKELLQQDQSLVLKLLSIYENDYNEFLIDLHQYFCYQSMNLDEFVQNLNLKNNRSKLQIQDLNNWRNSILDL